MSDLPLMIDPGGEIVRLITADHLLHAAGIEDVRNAELGDLANFALDADHLAGLAREAKTAVSDELVRRMDRQGRWTLHEAGLTVKSSSPTAGTERYDDEALAAALARLVQEDDIDQDAVTNAIDWVQPPLPAPYWKQKAAGIKALLKLGSPVVEAVEGARVEVEPPKRSAKVSRA
jgi:hypothetical protein